MEAKTEKTSTCSKCGKPIRSGTTRKMCDDCCDKAHSEMTRKMNAAFRELRI